MHRLFVAIRPPSDLRARLLDRMGGGLGLRWQDDAQLHLTLRFIGEVDRHLAEDVAAALGSVRHPPVTYRLEGVGSFDRRGRADTFWAGAQPAEPLRALANAVNAALRRVGIPPDTRAFHPHVTLARLPRSAGPLDEIAARWADLASEPVTATHFLLYESLLGHGGASYEAVQRYPLG